MENQVLQEQQIPHWWRAINVTEDEKIQFADRYILLCIVRGLQKHGNSSRISLDQIGRLCSYTDTKGHYHPFGRTKIDPAIERLVAAGKLEVTKGKLGECTVYTVKGLDSYERVPDTFFQLPYSPAEKGYFLFMMQCNLNKDTRGVPNNAQTYCAFDDEELIRRSHMTLQEINKIEKPFIKSGIVSITPTNLKSQETGLTIYERHLNLDAIQMGTFILQIASNLSNQIEDFEMRVDKDYVKKSDLKKIVKDVVKESLHELVAHQ